MISVRVYGILVNAQQQVLVSDEFIRGNYYTKFCGGGLEIGEGTRDCLKREFMEEMQLPVEVLEHLYTTDFYQQSAFNAAHQILSIYYRVQPLAPITIALRHSAIPFYEEPSAAHEQQGSTESFRFIEWEDFSEESVTLPIDKIVARMVKQMGSKDAQ